MNEVKKLKNDNVYLWLRDVVRIGNEAVLKAKEENKRLGLPEFFCKNGVIYYMQENGEITTIRPKILE